MARTLPAATLKAVIQGHDDPFRKFTLSVALNPYYHTVQRCQVKNVPIGNFFIDTYNFLFYDAIMLDKRYKSVINGRRKGYTMRRLNLKRLQQRFSYLVRSYMQKEDANQGEIADLVGIQRTHLNLLLNGKRPLSAYYVFQFIRTGVFKMSEIYDGKADTDREKQFWRTASEAENISLLSRIAELRKKGIDIDSLLNMVDPDKIKKQ